MLFNTTDIGKEKTNEKLSFSFCQAPAPDDLLFINARAKDLLKEISGELKDKTIIKFCTAGELSLHHLLQYFLKITGPADVYISTWALKEDPSRVLLFLKETGKIKDLYGVFDYRIRSTDGKHFQLIEKAFTKYVLTKNHSKVLLITGQNLSISIISSANFSNNPRIEVGYISVNTPSVEFHKQWMDKVLSGQKVY